MESIESFVQKIFDSFDKFSLNKIKLLSFEVYSIKNCFIHVILNFNSKFLIKKIVLIKRKYLNVREQECRGIITLGSDRENCTLMTREKSENLIRFLTKYTVKPVYNEQIGAAKSVR